MCAAATSLEWCGPGNDIPSRPRPDRSAARLDSALHRSAQRFIHLRAAVPGSGRRRRGSSLNASLQRRSQLPGSRPTGAPRPDRRSGSAVRDAERMPRPTIDDTGAISLPTRCPPQTVGRAPEGKCGGEATERRSDGEVDDRGKSPDSVNPEGPPRASRAAEPL